MEFINSIIEMVKPLFDNAAVIAVSLISILSSAATIATLFIDESKVNAFLKPIVNVLNIIAGNKLKNTNTTEVEGFDPKTNL
jgi:hypothetical protein